MDAKLRNLRNELRSTRDELQTARRDLKRLKKSLPTLPSPKNLYDKIVETARDVMYCTHLLDKLHRNASPLGEPTDDWIEREKDVQLLEAKTENCEMQLVLLRHTLRTIHAIPPVLIATKRISEEAWDAMMSQPQYYYHGSAQHTLPVHLDAVDNIISDQLKSSKDLLRSLRELRSHIFAEERSQEKSLKEKILKTMQSIEAELQQMRESNKEPEPSVVGHPHLMGQADADRHQELQKIEDNAEYMEEIRFEDAENLENPQGFEMEDGENLERLQEMRAELEVKIFQLENRIQLMEREKPCEPRSFEGPISRFDERHMRCAFCNAPGKHYSDSCTSLRDGESRRAAAEDSNRCYRCLEWWCAGGARCPKYHSRCFHCGKSDHHSALCCEPDVAEKMQIEIDVLKEEARSMRRQRDQLQQIIDQFNMSL